jgi:hypothetical protein
LATDEVGFTRNCVFNSRNTHIWSEENPHEIQERYFQQSFSLNVWIGIIENHLIGPYVLPRRLNGEGYLQFLTRSFARTTRRGSSGNSARNVIPSRRCTASLRSAG